MIAADVLSHEKFCGEETGSTKKQNRAEKRRFNSAEVLKRLGVLNANSSSAVRGDASIPYVFPVAIADEQHRTAQQDLQNDRSLCPANSELSVTVPLFLSSNLPDGTQDLLGLEDVEVEISEEGALPMPILGEESEVL